MFKDKRSRQYKEEVEYVNLHINIFFLAIYFSLKGKKPIHEPS